MAGKPAAPKKEAAPAAKGKKPRFKGINHPKNLHKGFRSSGNKVLIRAALEFQRRKPAPLIATAAATK